ncbi:unnamed protein product [Bursaphelenchus xylophilus]|uniref:(pine wood nematode) hypothetical protein n=1 Tax=Bursaphelenchus xylophilus TaxID=6326 RepID=A0A1I7RMU3_BURXY|nr:unnamed protein product [Bursaphelenchus xylophilus]CAG9125464.1 unnamed protein product [Bursaphelenchus xylophilus]
MCRARKATAAKSAKAKKAIQKPDTYASLMKKIINDKIIEEFEEDSKENSKPITRSQKAIKAEPIEIVKEEPVQIKAEVENVKEEPLSPRKPSILLCECCSPPMEKYSTEHMHQFYNPASAFNQMHRLPVSYDWE